MATHSDTPGGTSNEVSGTVHGPSVQAGTIRGGVHIHQPAARPAPLPVPVQLPPPGTLTGRDAERRAMDAARASGAIAVTGPPGVGKTALAVGWAHGVRAGFPDGALLADLRGHAPGGPATAAEVLGGFLRALGIDTRHVPAGPGELAGLYRSVMAGRRMLVVLDDALSAVQVLPLLPSGPQSVALVTSRRRLSSLVVHGARIVPLGSLSAGAALELLSQTIGGERVRAEPEAARELAELCGRLPLALRIAGARLAARPSWPVSEMTAAMTAEHNRLAALSTEEDTAVRSALDLSYRALPADAARMYRLAGLLPGTWFASGLAAAAASVPREQARCLLETLASASLLDDDARDQYRFHDLTRLHARETAERDEPPDARDEAVRRILDWYLATAGSASLAVTPYRAQGDLLLQVRRPPAEPDQFDSAAQALEWLDRELPNVLAAARQATGAGEFTVAWQLADAMWPVFLYRGRHAERLELDRPGLDAARASGDPLGEAKMLYRLGTAVLDDGQHEQAEEYISQAMQAWQGLGRPDKAAGSLRRLGYVAMARRMRRLHPYAAARYDRLRDEGARPLEAMRDAIDLFARAPHARPGQPAVPRPGIETGAPGPWLWPDGDVPPTEASEPAPTPDPGQGAVQRGQQIAAQLQARALAERGAPLSPGELAVALEATTTLPAEVIARLAHAQDTDNTAARVQHARTVGVDRAHTATPARQSVSGTTAAWRGTATARAGAYAPAARSAAQLAAESFPRTAADGIRAAVNGSLRQPSASQSRTADTRKTPRNRRVQ